MIEGFVEEIRNEYHDTDCTFQFLADKYGTSQTTVGDIIRGKIHSEIPGPISKHNIRRKLTTKEVREVRKSVKVHRIIAQEYGISTAHVSRIRARVDRKKG